jgi:3-deoxy-manno-octulosonate cytidylyltransferase (CMP-KDO synthetase)
MNVVGVIPARYESSRFPGKPLVDLGGKSMIQRTYEQCMKCDDLSHVVVATDNKEIFDHIKSWGGNVVMTRSNHQTGTDRIVEAVGVLDKEFEVVVNIQGDEPFIEPKQISLVVELFKNEAVGIGTLIKQIKDIETLLNPNNPKVVTDLNGNALFFSRETIPHLRGVEKSDWLSNGKYFKHIGIYGFRTKVLNEISRLPVSGLEKSESLEQLRWLENGYQIKTAITDLETIGIDSPEDIEKVKDFL